MKVRILPPAAEDITSIYNYIFDFNPKAAQKVIDNLEAQFELLSVFPYAGTARGDLDKDIRSKPSGSRTIIYSIENDTIVVRAVLGRGQSDRKLEGR